MYSMFSLDTLTFIQSDLQKCSESMNQWILQFFARLQTKCNLNPKLLEIEHQVWGFLGVFFFWMDVFGSVWLKID